MEANTPINIWYLRTGEETLEHVETNTFWMNFTAVLFENFFRSVRTHTAHTLRGGDNDILEDERRYTVSWHFNIGVAPSGLTIACNAWSWIVQCSQSQVLHLLGTISSSLRVMQGLNTLTRRFLAEKSATSQSGVKYLSITACWTLELNFGDGFR